MTYLTNALVLTLKQLGENNGRLCYKSFVNASNVAATSELASLPITNLANPSTSFGWGASSNADQTITLTNATATAVDYLGIARHNLGEIGAEIRIRFNGVTVRDWSPVSNQQSLLIIFEEATPTTIQVDLRNMSQAARIAVIYCGQSVKLQRNIYVGHTPVTYGRNRRAIQGVSQSGEYLGEVVLSETLSTQVSLQNLTPDWYRAELDPYFALNPRRPCFFAWRPGKYPAEVAYCWPTGNPQPVNQRSNGMMSINWTFTGIA